MKYAGVIFDLDGTLLDTVDDLADSANETLAKYGFKGHPVSAYKKFIGNGIRNLLQVASPEGTDEELIDSLLADFKVIYSENYINKTCRYEGVSTLLEGLQNAGLKMAICSNKNNKMTNEIVEKLIGKEYFEVIFGERDGIPKKPDPASLLEAADIMGVSVEKTIYVGDSGSDMVCAKRAGMFAAGALWGFRSKEELEQNGADLLISYPLELLKFLEIA